jgi:hypothetical protein
VDGIKCDGMLMKQCKGYPSWVIKAASEKRHACGTHLNAVCKLMLEIGVHYMTVSETTREFNDASSTTRGTTES